MARDNKSLGKLYTEIKISGQTFSEEKKKKEKDPGVPWFVSLNKKIYKRFPSLGSDAPFTETYEDAINFLGWKLEPKEFNASVNAVAVASLGLAIILGFVLYFSPLSEYLTLEITKNSLMTLIYLFGPTIVSALGVVYLFQQFPLIEAKREQVKALTNVPEIIGYMIMSMKLVPNLEKAVEFAASHGTGKIAEDLKRTLWEVQVGTYNTLSEGLDKIAYTWGKFSDEFKQALMHVRASVLENTEAKRYALLDKTMETVLDSIRDKMEKYARDLSQPSIILFYLGVLLPLILIIILPVGSAFSGQPLARPEILIFIYNIALPALALAFAFYVIRNRPPTYKAPIIPDDFPGLPPKNKLSFFGRTLNIKFVMAIVLVVGIVFSLGLSNQGLPPKFLFEEGKPFSQILPADKTITEVLSANGLQDDHFEVGGKLYNDLSNRTNLDEKELLVQLEFKKTEFFNNPKNDISPYNITFGILVTLSLLAFLFLYYPAVYKKKIQDDIVQMEGEFKDALYVIASRMGENKPVEEAIQHAREFLPQYKISQTIFAKTTDNINLLGLPLEKALFDPVYGSLKNIPSTIIQGSMKLLADSVSLGVEVAARTLMSLSMQLNNAEKVTKMLSTLISDITSMMRTMAVFIAPVVLGITTSLQKVVMLTLAQISISGLGETLDVSGAGSSGVGVNVAGFSNITSTFVLKPEALSALATPTEFLLIVAIYVIELVIILIYFTSMIEEDNDLKFKLTLAKSLPIAVVIFLVSSVLANSVLGNFFG